MKQLITASFLAIAGAVHFTPAQATILTFDGLTDCIDPVLAPNPYYEESGYALSGGSGICYGGFQDVHMDYAGDGGYHRIVDMYRPDGQLFSVAGFDFTTGFDYTDSTDPRVGNFVTTPGDNALVEGYVGGVLVDSVTFSFLAGAGSLSLASFGGFDMIRFRDNPSCACVLDFTELDAPYHFSVDNLDLRVARMPMPTVPLPSAIMGLGLGLMLLGGLKRRRKA